MNKAVIPKVGMEHNFVEKKILPNGMTILVRPISTIPKVSIQLWYNVGSADESDNERGIAHLIEHMIFKGTTKLSESDINTITYKLSGDCNAFTSYDFTGYLFNLPSQHWHEAFVIMADTMRNCSFKEDHLSSEMKAVIQELKLYKDEYIRSLFDEMIGVIFADHPYHHPIIGYKQDLWSVNSEDLKKFYNQHYVPNNAALVVVGDVNPDEVFSYAEKMFGFIPANPDYKKGVHYFNRDIASKQVTLYRDVKKTHATYCFVVPGIRSRKDSALELLTRVIARGKSSRLYHLLVNEKKLASSVSASCEELFDYGLFFIVVEPKDKESLFEIEKLINQEIRHLNEHGISNEEVERSMNQTEVAMYSLLEDLEHQAFEIGKYYFATNDPNYVFNMLAQPKTVLKKDMEDIIKRYFKSSVMHKGYILPLPEEDKKSWIELQDESDKEDERILSARIRETEIEPPRYADEIVVKDPKIFNFPKSESIVLDNGLKVLYYNNDVVPKVDIVLSFKAKHYYDPEGKIGLSQFVSKMMLEGTKHYSGKELAHIMEQRGIAINTYPGGIVMSLLSQDLPFALTLFNELITSATFPEHEIEKVRAQMIAKLDKFWDEPRYFSGQLVKEHVYAGHPYAKSSLGSVKDVATISREDLLDYYKKYISPDGARLAIVGDISAYTLPQEVKIALGNWQGNKIEDYTFPAIEPKKHEAVNYPMNRDQVVLRFAGLSISRKDPDFDNLLIFDQLFGGGSMASKLFELREQSGLFYTISGTTLAGADQEPGMISVMTLVSKDRLKEAEEAIKHTMHTAMETISEKKFQEAKHIIVHSLIDHFASNYNIAQAFLFIDKYNLPSDYFDTRAQDIREISIEDVKKTVNRVLRPDDLLILRVGRIN